MPGPLVTVVVSLKTGQTLKGALLEERSNALVLRAAQVASDEGRQIRWAALDGDVVIPLQNIDYYQQSDDPVVLS